MCCWYCSFVHQRSRVSSCGCCWRSTLTCTMLNNTKDYDTFGVAKAAKDSYTFLFNWLARFPEHKGSEFYMAGATYAGRFVPQLAQTILRYNRFSHDGSTRINLKGIMVQYNACTIVQMRGFNFKVCLSCILSNFGLLSAMILMCATSMLLGVILRSSNHFLEEREWESILGLLSYLSFNSFTLIFCSKLRFDSNLVIN